MSLNDAVADLHLKHASSLECTTSFTALILQGEFELPRKAFFDTKVFYPHVPSYQSRVLPSLYRQFEGDKKHKAKVAIKKLAAMLAEKRNEQYSSMMSCCLSFLHARSTICCVCGSRFLRRQITWVDNLAPVDLVNAEAHLGPA